jgi:hypothetical protein
MSNEAMRGTAVDPFLAEAKAGVAPPMRPGSHAAAGKGRLIFALDATASRGPTWDLATSITTQMFEAVGALGYVLDMQLCYFRSDEFKAFDWVSDAASLTRLMGSIRCVSGYTQINKVLKHAKAENAKHPVSALVFVGDALERAHDDPDALHREALALGAAGVRTFMLQEGDSADVRRGFEAIRQASGGAYAVFDRDAAQWLADMLKCIALYAAGGIAALEAHKDAASKLLLTQSLLECKSARPAKAGHSLTGIAPNAI